MEEKIVYFEEPGVDNTEQTLSLVAERAKARGIQKVILASTRGDTARVAAARWAGTGIKLVVIPHQYNFGAAGVQRFPAELVAELQQQGHAVHFGTMLFHTDSLFGTYTPRLISNLLRTFCQGMKVAVEIIFMAADAGLVATGETIIAVTGTARGADTAIVAIAATSNHLSDLHITEIICKPLQTRQGQLQLPAQPTQPPPPVRRD